MEQDNGNAKISGKMRHVRRVIRRMLDPGSNEKMHLAHAKVYRKSKLQIQIAASCGYDKLPRWGFIRKAAQDEGAMFCDGIVKDFEETQAELEASKNGDDKVAKETREQKNPKEYFTVDLKGTLYLDHFDEQSNEHCARTALGLLSSISDNKEALVPLVQDYLNGERKKEAEEYGSEFKPATERDAREWLANQIQMTTTESKSREAARTALQLSSRFPRY